MTYEQANSVKHLAPDVNKVLEGLEVKCCSKCHGTGILPSSEHNYKPDCYKCNGTGKIKWKWQPQVGEWWLELSDLDTKGHLRLIHNIGNIEQVESLLSGKLGKDWIIPILDWETIEGVLEKAGYIIKLEYLFTIQKFGVVLKDKNKDSQRDWLYAPTRQLAVMKAVLALRKDK